MKIYINSSINNEIYKNLKKYFDEIILLPAFDKLLPPVAAHADMLIYKTCDSLLIHKDYYDVNKILFRGENVTLTDENIGREYPNDILLNALKLNGVVYGRTDKISKYITNDADVKNLVYLKQGYAKCSICTVRNGTVSESALITSDINTAGKISGADVLLIRPGHILLDGYGYGFIGGASFNYKNETLFFFGEILKHPDGEKISEFTLQHGVNVVSLSESELYDYGSAIVV